MTAWLSGDPAWGLGGIHGWAMATAAVIAASCGLVGTLLVVRIDFKVPVEAEVAHHGDSEPWKGAQEFVEPLWRHGVGDLRSSARQRCWMKAALSHWR